MDWNQFQENYLAFPDAGFALDSSRMPGATAHAREMGDAMESAFRDMEALEGGAIANPDEHRMVGHYWLRAPELAPEPALADEIRKTHARIRDFAAQVHAGRIQGRDGPFSHILVIGIGGSALGPQFVSQALTRPGEDPMEIAFFDNTDPEGFDLHLKSLQAHLGRTLILVISKSGGTAETRNGMLEARAAFTAAGVDFAAQAVAVTGEKSRLDEQARRENWLARFPMWDWVGGRTSETGPVGLLPAALQGFDIDALLAGAAQMDALTRVPDATRNPAARLALMWHLATGGKGERDMVILPYKDRLQLFSRYLQQLVMESLGKELDLDGKEVHQGIAVYGNKGSTDQHAYVQQLREGVPNCFITFIEVLKDREQPGIEVEPGITSGDYLSGFLLGTREALTEKDRTSITLTLDTVNARSVGGLIALFERAVGFYASLIRINAYHQPGVEAGKKAASEVLALQRRIEEALSREPGKPFTAAQLAGSIGEEPRTEWVFKILCRLAANGRARPSVAAAPYPPDTRFTAPSL